MCYVCCAPDLVSTVFKMEELRDSKPFYNPNIFPEEEFSEDIKLLKRSVRVCQLCVLSQVTTQKTFRKFSILMLMRRKVELGALSASS